MTAILYRLEDHRPQRRASLLALVLVWLVLPLVLWTLVVLAINFLI